MVVLIFLLALLPGILWLWYVYKSDRFEPEPLGNVIIVFIGGFFAVFPAILIELGLRMLLGLTGYATTIYEAIGSAWFIAGAVEEVIKFSVVLFVIYFNKEFDEPVDGIVYASAAAVGFASLENFFYMLRFGAHVIVLRGPLSTLGHIVFSTLWGYGLGRGKFHPRIAKKLALYGLLLAALAHGAYNFLLMSPSVFGENIGIPLAFCVIPLTLFLWYVMHKHIKKSEAISPYNPHPEEDELDKYDDMNETA